MTTQKFINEVKKLGFEIEEHEDYFDILLETSTNGVATIDKLNVKSFDTYYSDYTELEKNVRNELFDIILQYATTPIKKRQLKEQEQEEKFYIFQTDDVNITSYEQMLKFATNKNMGNYYFGCKETKNDRFLEHSKISFTQSDIDKFPTVIKDMLKYKILKQVKVEDYNNETEN